jgi:hypothetical protein
MSRSLGSPLARSKFHADSGAVRTALESLLAQTFANHVLVVCDDKRRRHCPPWQVLNYNYRYPIAAAGMSPRPLAAESFKLRSQEFRKNLRGHLLRLNPE